MLFECDINYKRTVRVIKSRRLIWAGHIARIEEGRIALKISTDNLPLGKPRGQAWNVP